MTSHDASTIHVRVKKYGDRRNLVLYYRDPVTENVVTRSAGTTRRREAERAAAQWERELRSGRPITTEEFERMLAVAESVRPHDHQRWQYFLAGMWLSGLRLAESLMLSWDQHEPFCIDLSGRRPRFRIYAEGHKRRQDKLLPMTPRLLPVPGERGP